MREYLEKNYSETSGNDTVKLALKALTETVEAGSKNIEVAVVTRDTGTRKHPLEPALPPGAVPRLGCFSLLRCAISQYDLVFPFSGSLCS